MYYVMVPFEKNTSMYNIKKWIDDNCTGWHLYNGLNTVHDGAKSTRTYISYQFGDEEDAIAFKLRWI